MFLFRRDWYLKISEEYAGLERFNLLSDVFSKVVTMYKKYSTCPEIIFSINITLQTQQ
jgi:hypothetical protein